MELPVFNVIIERLIQFIEPIFDLDGHEGELLSKQKCWI